MKLVFNQLTEGMTTLYSFGGNQTLCMTQLFKHHVHHCVYDILIPMGQLAASLGYAGEFFSSYQPNLT